MAAIIRVKRRLDEDPAENLIVQCKKNKTDNISSYETDKFCLSLVATVESKEDNVSNHVQKALRRQKLQTSYKAHEARPVQQTREETRAKARANRYKIVNSNRALAADSDDSVSAIGQLQRKDSSEQSKKSVSPVEKQGPGVTLKSVHKESVSGSNSGIELSHGASPSSSEDCSSQSNDASPTSGDLAVHVFDVEQDSSSSRSPARQPLPPSGITLNGQSLISQPAPLATPESNYVYDLYYINNNSQQYNFRELENILSIEALHDELVTENERQVEFDEAYDDEDDSNDENNWRNDYPDEEPGDSEEDFDPDLLNMEEPRAYNYRDDDFLSEAVGSRLHLFGSSSSDNDEEEYGDGESGLSYTAFMKRAQGDLEEEEDVEDFCD